jgi:uncharacterized protein with GYD domain
MPTFICLLNWTDQGAKTAKDAGKRYHASKVLAEKLGGKLLTSYIATGQYDVIATLEMPDGQAMVKFAAALSASGGALLPNSLPAGSFARRRELRESEASLEITQRVSQSVRMISLNSSSTETWCGRSPCLTAKSMTISSERRLASMPKRSGSSSGMPVSANEAALASRNTR